MSADEHGSKEKWDADLEHSMLLAVASILRNRLIVVESVAAAKLYMESSTKSISNAASHTQISHSITA